MGFDLGHTVSSLSKLALRSKRRIDDNNKAKENLKIYKVWMDHHYRTYEPLQKDGYKSYMFEGIPVKDRAFALILPSEYEDEVNKPIGDVFSVEVSSFILNEYAFNILNPYLKGHTQVFRLKNQDDVLYVINVTDIIDCLDYDKSEIKRFPSSGRVMKVIEYSFHKDKLKNATIFKLPEFVKTTCYVTEEFKKATEENNIKGFKYEECFVECRQ